MAVRPLTNNQFLYACAIVSPVAQACSEIALEIEAGRIQKVSQRFKDSLAVRSLKLKEKFTPIFFPTFSVFGVVFPDRASLLYGEELQLCQAMCKRVPEKKE